MSIKGPSKAQSKSVSKGRASPTIYYVSAHYPQSPSLPIHLKPLTQPSNKHRMHPRNHNPHNQPHRPTRTRTPEHSRQGPARRIRRGRRVAARVRGHARGGARRVGVGEGCVRVGFGVEVRSGDVGAVSDRLDLHIPNPTHFQHSNSLYEEEGRENSR